MRPSVNDDLSFSGALSHASPSGPTKPLVPECLPHEMRIRAPVAIRSDGRVTLRDPTCNYTNYKNPTLGPLIVWRIDINSQRLCGSSTKQEGTKLLTFYNDVSNRSSLKSVTSLI